MQVIQNVISYIQFIHYILYVYKVYYKSIIHCNVYCKLCVRKVCCMSYTDPTILTILVYYTVV